MFTNFTITIIIAAHTQSDDPAHHSDDQASQIDVQGSQNSVVHSKGSKGNGGGSTGDTEGSGKHPKSASNSNHGDSTNVTDHSTGDFTAGSHGHDMASTNKWNVGLEKIWDYLKRWMLGTHLKAKKVNVQIES